ncbi:hypothetical protein E2C01_008755 [Portunus trituberculatus]|uniref:Uncharacterized protein n=1 Tax=Portunus trituberculatus TaxID=210409 RepID=A0A5B7D2P0_PORTR|nr:hypothetical protein [Portunus trituberculatus]
MKPVTLRPQLRVEVHSPGQESTSSEEDHSVTVWDECDCSKSSQDSDHGDISSKSQVRAEVPG